VTRSSHVLAQLKGNSRGVVDHGVGVEEGIAGVDVGHVEEREEGPASVEGASQPFSNPFRGSRSTDLYEKW